MGVFLVDSQRDAVYQYLLLDIDVTSTITARLRRGDVVLAQRLRRRFEEDMRLLDQIGWESRGSRDVYGITLDDAEIRSIFRRLLAYALQIRSYPKAKTAQTLSATAELVETARIVLQELPSGR